MGFIAKRYDFAISWRVKIKENFVDFLQKACKEKGLSFLWIYDGNLKDILKRLEQDKLKIRVLLDTEATYNIKGDIYGRLCYAVKDSGGVVINDPDRTKIAVDKSIMHFELMNTSIAIPYTIVVRNWEPNNFKLSYIEKMRLGMPFVIKPALGYGQLGVIRDARGSIREIAQARNFDRGDNFLLQEKIKPVELKGKRAWFRVFNVFDTIIPCWWDDRKNIYSHVLYADFNKYRLFPLARIVSQIAAITRMAWFSTEIAIDKKFGNTRFVAIDYVNDQCDMSTLSETTSGVPDYIVRYTADRIIEVTRSLINRESFRKKYTILLADANIELRGLGTSPDLIAPFLFDSYYY